MSEKQLLHEINSSREATEEIRKQILQAKQLGEEQLLQILFSLIH